MTRRRGERDRGTITALVVLLTTTLLLVTGLVLDAGVALAAEVDALGAAQEAARAGAQQLDLDAYRRSGRVRLEPRRAESAARRYLTAGGYAGDIVATTDQVTVTVTTTRPTQLLSLVGVDSFTRTATASARPRHTAA